MVNVMRLTSEADHQKMITKQETRGSVGIYSVSNPIVSTGFVAFKDSIIIPQHEQFYPEGLSVFAPFALVWIKWAQKFKDFPRPTAVFKDFQGVKLISKFKNFQGLSSCVETLSVPISSILFSIHSLWFWCGKFV